MRILALIDVECDCIVDYVTIVVSAMGDLERKAVYPNVTLGIYSVHCEFVGVLCPVKD